MSTEHNAFITETTIEPTSEGPLSGRTIAVKDNISTAGVRTTCGSTMLEEYVPPYDATVVERLTAAGATIVGKANMDEFGMGGTTETSAFGPTENPRAPGRVAGGSSGGSAAAVAEEAADLALGTDTGGSIRNPAAFCGVVGLKPTYGLVSRYGLIAYANSLEQIGPIAPTVEETATLLDVIAGPDENDATTHQNGADANYAAAADGNVDGMTIGVLKNLRAGADERVAAAFDDGVAELEARGATVVEIELDSIEHALAAYYVIAMSEASSNLARFDGVRYGVSGGYEGDWNESFAQARESGFGEEVKRRILLGTYALSAGYHDKYYKKAQDARAWVKQEFDDAFENADVLASPTMPVLPPEIGESLDDPLQLYQIDANTVPVNLANLPAISVPVGRADGFPVGFQLIGPAFGEHRILRAGSALQ
ncbi:Asp-tRNA(Asn)/Glu-tRNA(Gln) amidotransferase subunit GatA [Halocatena pleomorpha]|uniref:Glutamyl-tRNA(Gln) amidotransferase subunit A n=1 Tax=Halocatena pleomorpha TaxID=1785090 RepID=A0A3P3RJL4_9EURY|nr:Asp-tRNA(Asn)/Glu-tRNA(Gln) amidotransferase subunit GatA [Halocatena pleomorpha]RRJ33565.1 Asp-tRNA(Asn)/Glu-tRNA(Gln) amidotransferase subunit GatA [Halocatena pleomorpha]